MTKKRKAEDPNAPPKPKWTPPKDDPMWEDYAKDCLYDGYEMHCATSARSCLQVTVAVQACPDRSSSLRTPRQLSSALLVSSRIA